MRDGVVNYSGFIASSLAGLILVPVMLRDLGVESYGLWLAAMATADIFSGFDLGLSWGVTREVSGAASVGFGEPTVSFVTAAANLYLWLGVAEAGLVAALGVSLSRGLHLSSHNAEVAPQVFCLVAIGFGAERMVRFAYATLSGLRRFGSMNTITAGVAALRLAGSLLLLGMGRSIVAIAWWSAITEMLWAGVTIRVIAIVQPKLRFRFSRVRWQVLRPHLSFGILSLLSSFAVKVIWDMAPLVIGFLLGSAAIVPYSIGRRFPLFVHNLHFRAGESLFPAASERMKAKDEPGMRVVLQLGTRWIVVMAVPFCVILWILAPALLHAWVGSFTTEATLIMRLTCIAILAEALGMGSTYVLWGQGAARTIFAVAGILALPSFALTVGLVWRYGAAGAAAALCVILFVKSFVFVFLGARACHYGVAALLIETFRGLLLPNVACAALTYAFVRLLDPQHWPSVVSCVVAGGMTFLVFLYLAGGREEEKRFLRQILTLKPGPSEEEA